MAVAYMSNFLIPSPQLYLAPMQGLVDDVMRTILTQLGGFDACVTEFVRITHTVHSRATWLKYMPELANNGLTPAGTPVTMQLLGSDEENMAVNALNAVACGVDRIDLNFGCPAPTVNRHEGGAVLLRNPHKIESIVRTLRQRLPEKVMLSAKMRLGYDNKNLALACAQAIEAGGAQLLTVHARTKVEGYRPPAHWSWLAKIRQNVHLPMVANGDVFSLHDYRLIRDISGCDDVMLGRGAVMIPDLARQIANDNAGKSVMPLSWDDLLPWIAHFFQLCRYKSDNPKFAVARLKQWLGMMKSVYPPALILFERIRTLQQHDAIAIVLRDGANHSEIQS